MDDTPIESGSEEISARVLSPERTQVRLEAQCLEDLLPQDHRARAVWAFAEGLDLSEFSRSIRAVEGRPGRPAISPQLLVALWLYATVEGVGTARELARLCESHDAYRWLCGGVGVNYHTLSDFRVEHERALDRLLTQSVAMLLNVGLVRLNRVTQDGMRVRASASTKSFRGIHGLSKSLRYAQTQVERLRAEMERDPGGASRRERAAQERAARENLEAVEEALRMHAKIAERERRKPPSQQSPTTRSGEGPSVSTTDPEARMMKLADGGFAPAYNANFATDADSQVIVGVELVMASDMGQIGPMAGQIRARYGRMPRSYLADGGYASLSDIESLESEHGCAAYVPPPKRSRAPGALDQRRWDLPGLRRWRRRMVQPGAWRTYRQRAAVAEGVNAAARNRGLRRFWVRGRQKARAVLLWFALAHNLMRAFALRGRSIALA